MNLDQLVPMNLTFRLCLLSLLSLTTFTWAQSGPAQWIWYPGDFEIWLGNQVQARRVERTAFAPPFWRMDSPYAMVVFTKKVNLAAPEEITVAAEGRHNVTIDGRYVQENVSRFPITAGEHTLTIQVFNSQSVPSIWVNGATMRSDKSWTVSTINNTPFNLPRNDAPIQADAWNFIRADSPPSSFKLATEEKPAASFARDGRNVLVDFGQETFGFIRLKNLRGTGRLNLYYGESADEARATEAAETLDRLQIAQTTAADYTSPYARAFRFVMIQPEGDLQFGQVALLHEYLPLTNRGAFRSSDPQVNKIWEVAAWTLHLNAREFFFDGIKRDRWIWSGDANQSYLMNYYLFFDNASVKRTIWELRGKDPVETHINTILDYSFYWFVSIYDYYLYSGDREFLRQVYPRMKSLMDYCLSRRNANGMVEGLPGDWVFLDWAEMPKDGELSAVQLLFARSLEAMALCAGIVGEEAKATEYRALATDLRAKIMATFWDPARSAMLHSRKAGRLEPLVTRYANMFAMMFGYLTPAQTEAVKNNVILSTNVQKITTPYMRYYELEAMCMIGQFDYVTRELKSYWGGMLNEGATSFWEFYDPAEKGAARYAMYGRPFAKSLAHAWGASPLYLLGKYYLGVKPTKPGYEEYLVEPNLGGLDSIEGKVPTPAGEIAVSANTTQIKVTTVGGTGKLHFRSATLPTTPGATFASTGNNSYELNLAAGREYVVAYTLMK